MDTCACGSATQMVRFGPQMVVACSSCHRLRVTPIVDPRVPKFNEHVKALTEEIGVEEEEALRDKALKVLVESAVREKGVSKVRVQIVEGNARWVVAGSRLEGFLPDAGKDTDAVNVEVIQKAGSILELGVDDKAWGDLRQGLAVVLHPQTNATLYRNLLKAFLTVKRRFWDAYERVERPEDLPPVPDHDIKGLNVKGLRPSQATALRRALQVPGDGVLLIQGPPGTGKTTVIARIVEELVKSKRSVLVTSHTHVAIDNALRKSLKNNPLLATSMVRLGDSGRIAVDLQDLGKRVSSFRAVDPEDPDAKPLFATLQERHGIVGMTLDALAVSLLNSDINNEEIAPFDTVIVDEAGMNGFPKIAIAAALSRRLILVGDPLQLPPIVRAWSFRSDENYKRSHFEVLQMLRPDLAVLLDEQFRCHPDIYAWSEGAVYGGKVTSQAPKRPIPVSRVLGQDIHSPVVWIDTSKVAGNRSEQVGTSRINPTHTRIALEVLSGLARARIPPDEVGYIAPFRAQADVLRAELEERSKKNPGWARMTASTVDAFQGNERRFILFDLTTTHPAKPHEDHRRLNVSLTRAQELLIIIGPRPFVKVPKENPFLWSLQNWKDAQTLQPVSPDASPPGSPSAPPSGPLTAPRSAPLPGSLPHPSGAPPRGPLPPAANRNA